MATFRGRDGRYLNEETLQRMEYIVRLDRAEAEKHYGAGDLARSNAVYQRVNDLCDEISYARKHEA